MPETVTDPKPLVRRYIFEEAEQLCRMANESGYPFLAYLLSLTVEAAAAPPEPEKLLVSE